MQYLCSKFFWKGPGGVIKLISKSGGYSRTVSAFALCEFGLEEVNNGRFGSECGTSVFVS